MNQTVLWLLSSFLALQLTYSGTKISTLDEVFDFVRCVDKKQEVKFNIESKVNAATPDSTRSPEDFVKAQHAVFLASGYPLAQLTVRSTVPLDDELACLITADFSIKALTGGPLFS